MSALSKGVLDGAWSEFMDLLLTAPGPDYALVAEFVDLVELLQTQTIPMSPSFIVKLYNRLRSGISTLKSIQSVSTHAAPGCEAGSPTLESVQ